MTREVGWLIELVFPGIPAQWAAPGPAGFHWISDANHALRFARKVDAEAAIQNFPMPAQRHSCVATEHVWDDGHTDTNTEGTSP